MKFRILLLTLLLAAACREPEARWPIEAKSGSFLEQSAARNKRLLAEEEALMARLIAADSLHQWEQTASGSRFYYLQKNPGQGYTPQPDDLVTLTYNLMTWGGDTLYRAEELGVLRYKVDKQELFPGLRNSVKLLQQGEKAVFMYPSSLGYGYHGDEDRIGPNVPLKATLEILDIQKSQDANSTQTLNP
ncbi:gliding motility-associated peptidyl-prolyl isomerase GldI [Robiginitalea sp. M366]|uniref:gliding motility-associated peptidyl-prolyl isomerase GldI n=1 Tax=Robiginitalea aestuariiviva TaxID=3036903 RepID=UPI00240E6516|nr:gliding motility-associated peptidyl-prolyl isomerase GldI [Robiginitalea aestuariiviva]MDG1573237.1 gliding motility-associated peptidyl-prolyl isomerase GldI [Robiginitalea aestuariiviva]